MAVTAKRPLVVNRMVGSCESAMAARESNGQYPSNWLKYNKFPTKLVWLVTRKTALTRG